MPLHKNIVLKEVSYGRGIFASGPIEEGEVVWTEGEDFGLVTMSKEEMGKRDTCTCKCTHVRDVYVNAYIQLYVLHVCINVNIYIHVYLYMYIYIMYIDLWCI